MRNDAAAICLHCGRRTQYHIVSAPEQLTVRDITFRYMEMTAYCDCCNEEVYVPEINDENACSRDEGYRNAANLITVSEIAEILEKYKIGAGPLARLLGFGDVTIQRYLGGQLPAKSHSDRLLEIRASYKQMEQCLEEKKEQISAVAYSKCRAAIDQLKKLYDGGKTDVVARSLLSKNLDITPMALQKLLYYAQGFFMALYHRPLFSDRCQAWAYGPVFPEIYYKYREFGYDPIRVPNIEYSESDAELTEQERQLLDAVISSFGRYSGRTLSWMTHNEAPWLETRKGLPPKARCVAEIDPVLIQKYFDQVVREYHIAEPCDISRYCEEMLKNYIS